MAVAMDPGRQLRGVEGQIEGFLMAICFFKQRWTHASILMFWKSSMSCMHVRNHQVASAHRNLS